VTTFGPGEISALCGVGGSYCEDVPVVHIVGYPSLRVQNSESGLVLHHTLADLRYELRVVLLLLLFEGARLPFQLS
jgi:pyruvate decarboxylase